MERNELEGDMLRVTDVESSFDCNGQFQSRISGFLLFDDLFVGIERVR